MIYLDNAATTRPYTEVLDLMRTVADTQYANPHALHAFGVEAERLVTGARKALAESLKALPSEIVFTSGGTESNNMALYGVAALPARYGNHLLTTAIEHPAVLEPMARLQREGFETELLPVQPDGNLHVEDALAKIRPDTRLLSMMLVNNESGVILPVAQLAREAKRMHPNLLIHVDAVQAFGKIPFTPAALGADFVSFSAHKLHGPKGVGALFVRKGARFIGTVLGGGQEAGLRSGTLNVPGICGFAMAAATKKQRLESDAMLVTGLKDQLFSGLQEAFPEQIRLLSPVESSSPYILLVAFEKAKAEVLLHHLAERGIYVSSGSACASRKEPRSHVLKAMKVPDKWQEGVLRFSFSGLNTQEEIGQTLQALREIYPVVRHR